MCEPHRTPYPDADRNVHHSAPAHLQVAGEALPIGRVEHEICVELQFLKCGKREPRKYALALRVWMRRRVHRPDRCHGRAVQQEPPPHERAEPDHLPLAFGHDRVGTAEGIPHVLPLEELGWSAPGRSAT